MAKKIKILQVKSSCKSSKSQKATLKGLGLRKIGSVSELQDTPAIRGMVVKVQHLLKVQES